MSTVKEQMLEIIGRQPDDSSYDEVLRELAFARMVQRGLDDADAKRVFSDESVRALSHRVLDPNGETHRNPWRLPRGDGH